MTSWPKNSDVLSLSERINRIKRSEQKNLEGETLFVSLLFILQGMFVGKTRIWYTFKIRRS